MFFHDFSKIRYVCVCVCACACACMCECEGECVDNRMLMVFNSVRDIGSIDMVVSVVGM